MHSCQNKSRKYILGQKISYLARWGCPLVTLPESSTQTVHWLEDLYRPKTIQTFSVTLKTFSLTLKKGFCAKQRRSFSGRQTDKGTDIEIEKGWGTHQSNGQKKYKTYKQWDGNRKEHSPGAVNLYYLPQAGKNNNSSQRRWHLKIHNRRNRFCKWCGIFSVLAFAWWCGLV